MTDTPDTQAAPAPGDRSGLAARRVVVGAIGGILVAALAVAEGAAWSVAALFASDVAALVFVVWVWVTVIRADAAVTARIARSEDASRAAAAGVLIGAGVASLRGSTTARPTAGSTSTARPPPTLTSPIWR